MREAQKSPNQSRGRAQAGGQHAQRFYGRDAWRAHLPSAETYYRKHVAKLGRANGTGWAQGRCPFHEDAQASLSVNLNHGGWCCFAGCGRGDMVSFHQQRTGLDFAAAVAELTGGRP